MKDTIPSPSPMDQALELADTYGWHVFPMKLVPEGNGKNRKIPLSKWSTEATNDPDKIEALNWNDATHVGVSCAPSGVWVIDEDEKGATHALGLTKTLILGTARGRHFVFKQAEFDQRNTQSSPAPSVDIRGNGGMFVWYDKVILDTDIAPWPFEKPISNKPAITDQHSPHDDTGKKYKGIAEYKSLILAASTDGQKHAATRDIAASLAAQGVSFKFAAALIKWMCPVNDANLMNSIKSGYAKYHRPSFRHTDVELIRDAKGRPIWNVANAEMLLTHHSDWEGVLGFNELTGRRVVLEPIPGTTGSNRQLEDDDYTAATGWFNRNGFPGASAAVTLQAVRRACRANTFDPLCDYLDGLVWDGTERLATWLIDYGGALDTEFNREVGERWMISAVVRAYQPGTKVDHMLILEGPQGAGKSSGIRALAGDGDMFGDNLPDMTRKDAQEYVRGKWIIEVAELVATRREIDAVKSFITRETDEFRWSYGREVERHPRRCVFIGTTNDDAYLRDETGNRRFWPVKIKKMDVAGLTKDRDQLWAEAVTRYRNGDRWWLPPELEGLAQEVQAERLDVDPWQSDVAAYVAGKDEVAPRQILTEAMDKLRPDITRTDSNRVTSILRVLGFERQGKFTCGQFKDAPKYVRKSSDNGGQ